MEKNGLKESILISYEDGLGMVYKNCMNFIQSVVKSDLYFGIDIKNYISNY